ncbi:carboxymuconolactone decarboxylase family protein [uncultured Jatrophihabitans sp.]|uniref:carboxymuconolactone decarboxylase family protein n=1 Tax=uncultured Jatrophihabitans sp. TaxID=1610747 RepID=UPI0035CAD2F0
MPANAPDDEKHLHRYLSANCSGDTVGRDGIDLKVRELLTFSMVTALGGAVAQVRGHVSGNSRSATPGRGIAAGAQRCTALIAEIIAVAAGDVSVGRVLDFAQQPS